MKKLFLGLLIGLGLSAGVASGAWSLPPVIQRGDLVVATSTTQAVRLATGTQGSVLSVVNGVPKWVATSTLGFIPDGVLPIASGGTNQSSYTTNGVLFYDGTQFNTTANSFLWNGTSLSLSSGSPSYTALLDVNGSFRINGPFLLNADTGTTGDLLLSAGAGNPPTWTSVATAGLTPCSRTISTTAPLQGGGNLCADLTFSIAQSSSGVDGYLSGADWDLFNGKMGFDSIQAGTNITIDTSTPGTMILSATGGGDSAWTIGDGFINNATSTDRVGIGTSTPNATLHVQGNPNFSPLLVSSSTGDTMFRVGANGYLGINTNPYYAIDISYGIRTGHMSSSTIVSRLNSPSAGTGRTVNMDAYLNMPWLSVGEYQNFLLQTEDFSNASWAKIAVGNPLTGGIVAANNATSSIGTLTAEYVYGTTSTSTIFQILANTVTSTPWTFSVWIKSAGNNGTPATTTTLRIDSNTASGTPLEIYPTTTWKRYSVTEPASTFSTAHASVRPHIMVGTSAIAVYGAQLEPTFYPRPYSGAYTTSALTTSMGTITSTALIRTALSVTGGITASGAGTFVGVAAGGAISGATTITMNGAFTGATTGTFTGTVTNTQTASSTGTRIGALLTNTTAAIATSKYYSPALALRTFAWSTGISQSTSSTFYIENRGTNGTVGTGAFSITHEQNNASATLFTILGTGNVGIGTTSPSQLLTVGNNNQFTVTSGGVVTNQGETVNGALLSTGSLTVRTNTVQNDYFTVYSDTSYHRPIIAYQRSRGSYGNGSSTLASDLLGDFQWFSSYNTGFSTWAAAQFGAVQTGNADSNSAAAALYFSTNPGGGVGATERMRIDSNGRIGIGNTAPGYLLDVYPTVATADDLLRVATSTGAGLVVKNNGNVGIGTTSPTSLLHVAGTFTATGSTTLTSLGTGNVCSSSGSLYNCTVSGSLSGGTNGYLARWTSASTLSTSLFLDNGTVAGVNATSSTVSLNVQGSGSLNPFNVASSSGSSIFSVTADGQVRYTALVSVIHADGTMNQYNATTTTDIARGQALLNAIKASTTGDTIYLSANTFDIATSTIDLSVGGTGTVHLIGSGKYNTIIKSSSPSSAFKALVHPGNNSHISDLSIIGTLPTTNQLPLGASSSDSVFKNAYFEDIYIEAMSDGIYFNQAGSTAVAKNITASTSYDAIVLFGDGTRLDLYDSEMRAKENNIQNTARAVVINTGATMNSYNNYIEASEGTTETYGYAVYSGVGNILNIYGGVASTTATGSMDIFVSPGTGIVNITSDTRYNGNKSSTSGINYVGVGTTTSASIFNVQGRGALNILTLSSSTGSTLFNVGANGSTTISSLSAGILQSTASGSLFISNQLGNASTTGLTVTGVSTLQNVTLSGTLNVTATSTLATTTISGINVVGMFDKSFQLASTTVDTFNLSFSTATTTFQLWNPSYPVTLKKLYCKTDTGTVLLKVGSNLLNCTSSGASSTPSTNYSVEADFDASLGSSASSPNRVRVTATFNAQ